MTFVKGQSGEFHSIYSLGQKATSDKGKQVSTKPLQEQQVSPRKMKKAFEKNH